jgi:hypothetical protein
MKQQLLRSMLDTLIVLLRQASLVKLNQS